jgi:hypothetical protein
MLPLFLSIFLRKDRCTIFSSPPPGIALQLISVIMSAVFKNLVSFHEILSVSGIMDAASFPGNALIIGLAGLLAFVFWWSLVVCAIGYFSGWKRLVRHYPQRHPFKGKWIGGETGYVNRGRYKGHLRIGIDSDGLHLATGPWLLFRPGHHALCIPWNSLKTTGHETISRKFIS